jgi:putative nucleotidyltransferase with HDIG domain
MQAPRKLLRRVKLRTLLLLILLSSGLIPLGISAGLLIRQSQEVLRRSESDNLLQRASTLAQVVDSYLAGVRSQISQVGRGILLGPGPDDPTERLREPWVKDQLDALLLDNRRISAVRVLDVEGQGPGLGALGPAEKAAMDAAFEAARKASGPSYRFVKSAGSGQPRAALALPVSAHAGGPPLYVEAFLAFQPLAEILSEEKASEVSVCLIDRHKNILWSDGRYPALEAALKGSPVLEAFADKPLNMTQQYLAEGVAKSGAKGGNGGNAGKGEQEILAQVSAISETGWGLVVQKPLSAAYPAVQKMFWNALLSTALLVCLALFFAYVAARWVSAPISRLTATTHAVAAGNFSGRLEPIGLTLELSDLADDFNRMSGHVERYVQQLREAAIANRDLFIGSLRAFAAAIDAKDPYTRGHSERVASVSRTIARHLQLPEEIQHKVWIGALLHDVGKIGVEDHILRKEGVLAPEEYDQMKMHTVIGAEIMAPIEQLREMIPAIRSHHEAWNGRGYPDGIKGEQINLFARIVAVADTFDAITTNRPYQQAYSLQFAVETITRLAGSRFDAKIVTAFLRAYEAGEVRSAPPRQSRLESTLVEARAGAPR